jgi:hypothetical protein
LAGVTDIRIALALFAFLQLSTAARAADDSLDFEITPFGGYRFGGTFDVRDSSDALEMRDSSSVGLILNLRERANTQWEFIYSQQNSTAQLRSTTQPAARVDIDIQYFQVGGTYQWEGDVLRPYLAATIGGTRVSAPSENDAFFSGSIGLGFQIMPESRVGFRVEARAWGSLTDSDSSLFCSVGPDENICAVRIDGSVLGQVETFAGVVFRF